MLSTNILKIENAIQELYDLNLVDLNVELDWIEGISFAEVNNLLDKIMKRRGGIFNPQNEENHERNSFVFFSIGSYLNPKHEKVLDNVQ